ncbi:hypothetical protein ACWD7M_16990 [Streptomyces griseus]
MATVIAPEPPAFVDKTLELAKEAGWNVARKTATFTLIPPDGVKAQRVTIKRTTPPTGEQLATMLKTSGFTRHMVELGLTGHPEATSEPEESEPKPEALSCPECSKLFVRPAALGAHRSRAHGVKGANTKRKKGPAAPASAVQVPAAEPETAPAPVPAPREETQPSVLEQHVSRFTAQVHRTALALCDEVTSEMSRTIAEKDRRIEELTAEVTELQAFKNTILGAVSSSQAK